MFARGADGATKPTADVDDAGVDAPSCVVLLTLTDAKVDTAEDEVSSEGMTAAECALVDKEANTGTDRPLDSV